MVVRLEVMCEAVADSLRAAGDPERDPELDRDHTAAAMGDAIQYKKRFIVSIVTPYRRGYAARGVNAIAWRCSRGFYGRAGN